MVAVFVIALLIEDTEKTSSFWLRLGWIEFLLGLVLAYNNNYLSSVIFGSSIKGAGGAMPAVGITLYIYAISSASLVIASSYFSENALITRYHLIIQIVLATFTIVTYTLINFSLAGAVAGSEVPQNVVTPSTLVTKLKETEMLIGALDKTNSNATISSPLKNLREKIQYGLPHAGKALSSDEYFAFASEVSEVCSMIQTHCQNGSPLADDLIQSVNFKLNTLLSKIGSIR